MNQDDILTRLAVSLAIGLLVGLERGWRTRDEEDHMRAAGLRTFALSGLLGGVTGAVSREAGGQIVGWVFFAYTGAFAAFHWLQANAERNLSATSVVAGMLTFLLGTMAVIGDLQVAIAGAVAMTVLLALRDQLHRWVARLTWPEIRAVLTLLAMTFLLMPILPDRAVDPWEAINPRQIWLLAVLLAGLSFLGYVTIRVLGDQLGIITTAIAGGLASSTATTLTFARMAREHPEAWRLLGAGILISSVIMMVRVVAVAVALNRALFAFLAPALGAAAAVLAIGAAVVLYRNREQGNPHLQIGNPLAIGTALKLAVFIAAVMVVAEVVRRAVGDVGVLIVAGLSGVADVDAITITLARLGLSEISADTAARGILVAVAVNTASKAMLAAWTGGRTVGSLIGVVSALAIVALAAAAWAVV
ncbi:MAG TPA: MgtC/SapB family protein [Xanthobacteraceae bacterium]|nr:MgtC/SapB family protein [Xanthobacteraceae bacterium]